MENRSSGSKDKITVESLLSLCHSKSARSERHSKELSSSIAGKSIVLGNTKAQTQVIKYAHRVKNQMKRKRGQTLSKKECKRRGLADASAAPAPGTTDVLHAAWKHYVSGIMTSCSGQHQLESRLASLELVGAAVTVLDYQEDANMIGLTGVVTGTTVECLFVATPSQQQELEDGSKGRHEKTRRSYDIHRLVRSKALMKVVLPERGGQGIKGGLESADFLVLHGADTTFTLPSDGEVK